MKIQKQTRDFNLFEKYSSYTDDSALTIAVCDALLKSKDMLSTEELKKNKNQKTIKEKATSVLYVAKQLKDANQPVIWLSADNIIRLRGARLTGPVIFTALPCFLSAL